ncbi:hypothetical protein ABFS83_10G081600 [Erythranthe nasuta]
MVVRRVELQETVEQLFQIVFSVYLLLQNHLQHRLPEVQVRVVGVLLHRHARPADPPESLHRLQAPHVGVRVGGLAPLRRLHGGGERGRRRVPGVGAGGRVVAAPGRLPSAAVSRRPRPRVEHGGDFRPPAAAAAPHAHRVQNVLLLAAN